ncbi:MAG: tRNA lysidine(34) synthetase TilS [Gudongella sp.]|nr:tRNA lysidine(34) synthetase TilS [Gudongella sp.]
MIDVVKSNIEKYRLLKDTGTVLAAVSGGPDSMAMLYCLYRLKDQLGIKLIVAHVNHGVRGDLAKRDQDFVQGISREFGLDYYTTNVDMAAYGREHGMTAEEAGRLLRYGFFRDVLKDNGGGRIAVAHNKNDQAETVLHRIIRGTGLDGIRAMSMLSGDIIRPLLNITRKEIEAYIEDSNIPSVEDHTNLQTVYTRNRIRLELLPYLRDNFNPNIIDSLYRLSEIAQLDLQVLDDEIEKKYNLLVKNRINNSIIFRGEDFLKEDEGSARRLIRRAILDLLGDLNGFGEVHIQNATQLFFAGETGKSVHLGRNITAEVSYGDLIVKVQGTEDTQIGSVALDIGRNILADWGIVVTLEESDGRNYRTDESRIAVDKGKLDGDIIVRQRKNGDRIKPLGMNGTKKVKDLFIDNKIPREEREKVPIFADKKGIIWIPGNAFSREYKVEEDSSRVFLVTIERIEEEKN